MSKVKPSLARRASEEPLKIKLFGRGSVLDVRAARRSKPAGCVVAFIFDTDQIRPAYTKYAIDPMQIGMP